MVGRYISVDSSSLLRVKQKMYVHARSFLLAASHTDGDADAQGFVEVEHLLAVTLRHD